MSVRRYAQALVLVLLTLWVVPLHAQCSEPIAWLTPRECGAGSCARPVVDTLSMASEYADGFRQPLQDFLGGRPDGSLEMVLDGDTLFLRVAFHHEAQVCGGSGGENPSGGHTVQVLIDANPADQACSFVNEDDRRITFAFEHNSTSNPDGSFSTVQGVGTGTGWRQANTGEQFPLEARFSRQVSAGQEDELHVYELAATLRSRDDIDAGVPAKPLEQGRFGLGVTFVAKCTSTNYNFPNRPLRVSGASIEGQVDDEAPGTWATVRVGEPISAPMRIASYNVGQMPVPIADGGAGEPLEFGAIASHAEHICMQETWRWNERAEIWHTANMLRAMRGEPEMQAVGIPTDPGLFEDFVAALDEVGLVVGAVTLVATGGVAAPVIVAVATSLAVATLGDSQGAAANGEDNGLLLLSSRPIVNWTVGEFPTSLCHAEDCAEDKGFLWARVLSEAADPEPDPDAGCDGTVCEPDDNQPPIAFDGSEFLDLFCTHLQNDGPVFGDAEKAVLVRDQQATSLRQSMTALRSFDRPALLVGDFNFDGRSRADTENLYGILGLSELSAFDGVNTILSDRYDLGVLGEHTTLELDAAIDEHGTIGHSTQVAEECSESDPFERKRLDFAFVIPTDSLTPSFGILGGLATPVPFFPGASLNPLDIDGSDAAPVADGAAELDPPVDRGYFGGPARFEGPCLSDHASLFAHVDVVRLRQGAVWNPTRSQRLTHHASTIETLEGGDCFLCGGRDYYGTLRGHVPGAGVVFFDSDFGPNNNQDVTQPGVSFSESFDGVLPFGATQAELAQRFETDLMVFEHDVSSPDDTVDVSPSERKNILYTFFYVDGIAVFEELLGGTDVHCDLKKRNPCIWWSDGSDDEWARVTHQLTAEEVED